MLIRYTSRASEGTSVGSGIVWHSAPIRGVWAVSQRCHFNGRGGEQNVNLGLNIRSESTERRPICLRRAGAFAADWILLAVAARLAEIIGWNIFLFRNWGLRRQYWPEIISEILFALVVIGYFVCFQAISRQTVGKMLFGLKVDVGDRNVGARMTLRFLIYPGPLFLLFVRPHEWYLAALAVTGTVLLTDVLFVVFSRDQGLSLHDWLGGTRIVRA